MVFLENGKIMKTFTYCKLALYLCLLATFILNTALATEQDLNPTQQVASLNSIKTDPTQLERAKFEFNVQLERDKLSIERLKAWITGFSVLIPLALGVITLAWQSRSALILKRKDASDAFQLKAAELVLGSQTPAGARSRADALKKLFPEYLPSSFAGSFDFSKLPGIRAERKLELLRMLAEHAEQRDEIVQLWLLLFPEESEWLQRLITKDASCE